MLAGPVWDAFTSSTRSSAIETNICSFLLCTCEDSNPIHCWSASRLMYYQMSHAHSRVAGQATSQSDKPLAQQKSYSLLLCRFTNVEKVTGRFIKDSLAYLVPPGSAGSPSADQGAVTADAQAAAPVPSTFPARTSPHKHHVHMDSLYLHSGYSRPLRPNVYDGDSRPSIRVSSDPDSSSRPHLHKHKSSHRHHRHHDDEHRRHSSTRHHAKDVVQSALQPPTSFGDLLKQARGSKDSSPSHSRSRSRRRSPTRKETEKQQKTGASTGLTIPPPRLLRPEEVGREAKRVEARERYNVTAQYEHRQALT